MKKYFIFFIFFSSIANAQLDFIHDAVPCNYEIEIIKPMVINFSFWNCPYYDTVYSCCPGGGYCDTIIENFDGANVVDSLFASQFIHFKNSILLCKSHYEVFMRIIKMDIVLQLNDKRKKRIQIKNGIIKTNCRKLGKKIIRAKESHLLFNNILFYDGNQVNELNMNFDFKIICDLPEKKRFGPKYLNLKIPKD